MLTLSTRHQLVIGTALVSLIIVTRGQHFATLHAFPSAPWAAFFLAGVYLRPRWVVAALLALTWSLDFSGYAWGSGSSFCITPAYLFLVPAYGALWLAGRWYAGRHTFAWRTLVPLGGALLVGAAVCQLFSSGGFYFFSGHFSDPTLSGLAARLVKYYPVFLQSAAFYVAGAAVVHAVLGLTLGATRVRNAKAS